MPTFRYEALDTKGRVVTGTMQANNVEAVVGELRNLQYTVTNVKESKDYMSSFSNILNQYQRVNLQSLAVFTRQFATMFNAGLPLVRGLEGLAKQTDDKKLSEVLMQIHDDVKNGASLTRAMQKHSTTFSPVYIALVRAGEMAGALGDILERLASLLEREFALKKKVQSAMIYPLFIFLAACGLTFMMVTYIFPQFMGLLEGLDVPMPLPTKILLFVTNALKDPIVIALSFVVFAVGIFLLKQYFKTPLGRRQLDRLMVEMPVIGRVNKAYAMSRFCRTMGTLIGSGVPVLHSLDVVGKVSGNEIISDIIDEIKMSLKSGMKLSEPMKSYDIFPPMVTQMVSVGEETGTLPTTLTKLADSYDTEIETALDAMVSLIEPLMVFFMGGIVGFVLLAVFLPIYSILAKF